MPEYRLKVNGRRLHAVTGGPPEGQAVVLLHHGLGSTRAWKEQIPALAGAGYRVVAYDRWGYGKSEGRDRLSMPVFDEDILDLLELTRSLSLQPAHLVGHSDGGTVALYFAARYPDFCRSLTIIAAHIYVEPKMEPGIESVRQAFEHDQGFRSALQRVHGEKYAQVFKAWYDGWRQESVLDWDMRPELGKIACPALIVQGLEDEHATPQHARDLAASIPGAELWLAPEANHMLPQEKAQTFNRRLLGFLEQVT